MKFKLLAAFSLLAVTPCLMLSGEQVLTLTGLAQASNKATDLIKIGPYKLQGTVIFYASGKQAATGHVLILRDSGNSREEIQFSDYRETAVTNNENLYITRTGASPLPFAQQLHTLDRLWKMTLADKVKEGPAQQKAGSACFTLFFEKNVEETDCFDSDTQLLTSRENKETGQQTRLLFSGFKSLNEQKFPTTIQYFQGNTLSFEVRDIDVQSNKIEPGAFNAPPGAVAFRSCLDVQPPRLIKNVFPTYPMIARISHIQGDVYLGGTIDTNGSVINLRVVRGHPTLADAAISAVKQWHYIPATCSFGPVESETQFKITFHM